MHDSCRSSHLFSRPNGHLHRGACCVTTGARCFSMLISFVIRQVINELAIRVRNWLAKRIPIFASLMWTNNILESRPLPSTMYSIVT